MDVLADRLQAARRLRNALESVSNESAEISVARALFELAEAVPYQYAALSWWDPVAGAHRTSASLGYPSDSIDVVNRCMPLHPLFAQLRERGLPMRLFDVPARMRTGPVFESIFVNKFSDGLSQCLHARDGRYIGMLNMSTTGGHRFDELSVATVTLLSDVLAAALDPLARRAPAPPRMGPADSVLVVAADGAVRAMTAGAPTELFRAGTPGGRAAHQVTASDRSGDFVFVGAGPVLRVRMDPVRSGGTLVVCRPDDPPMGLTAREAEVLALLPTGASNSAIAAHLRIGPATVATHLERILRKIDAPNRTAAAATAARWGLTPT
ncbi:LuxR family transcriptional regulator [Prescottella agglutinans]|uniref:LuxR family transcriptional regulator n=1 Tax=Prescottella agglutinans TaxID=1644129 RepID=A0A3S3E9H2_9NOCA|nr:helix-turn-helix transcriptional regulator [Prescottella agglutinans]RVW08389.1 LuxR family transcriptional regulator [Prescottella agglutinans]